MNQKINRHGAIDLEWAGGEHTFRLGLAEIEELEAEIDMSIFTLFTGLGTTVPLARVKHYSATIRIGLIGGGMEPVKARQMTRRWVDERPLYESASLAEAIIRAGIERPFSLKPEEHDPEGEASAPQPPPQGESTSAPYMPPPPSSASPTSAPSVSDSMQPS